jgi:HMG (high mobility group) box
MDPCPKYTNLTPPFQFTYMCIEAVLIGESVTLPFNMPTKKSSKFKKAPGSPRRFKSAFIYFSSLKHKEIRNDLTKNGEKVRASAVRLRVKEYSLSNMRFSFCLKQCTTPQVAKLVSAAWKALPTEEREHWEAMAYRDKARFKVEMDAYHGPLKVPKNCKTQRDPKAPKRPASAFLSYSNEKRESVKRANPGLGTTEISTILAKMWKEGPPEERQFFLDQDALERQAYKKKLAEFKRSKDSAREMREHIAVLEAVGAGLCSAEVLCSSSSSSSTADPASLTVADLSESDDDMMLDDEDWDPLPLSGMVNETTDNINRCVASSVASMVRNEEPGSFQGEASLYNRFGSPSTTSSLRAVRYNSSKSTTGLSPTSVRSVCPRDAGPWDQEYRTVVDNETPTAPGPYYPYWNYYYHPHPHQYEPGSLIDATLACITTTTPTSDYDYGYNYHSEMPYPPEEYPSHGNESWP